jgi:ribosomal protein S18 acetylase RimI-like enzyme
VFKLRNDEFFQRKLLSKARNRFDRGSLFLLALKNEQTMKKQVSMYGSALLGGCLFGTVEVNDFDFKNTTMENIGSPNKLYIADLAVREDSRRMGIATTLLKHIEDFAFKHGFDELYLHVEAFNEAARRLYLKNGFSVLPPSYEVTTFTESHLLRSADSFSLMFKPLKFPNAQSFTPLYLPS